MQIHELTALARNSKASDIHISEGLPLMFRIDGHLAEAPVQLSAAETRSLILSLMDEAHREAITSERIDADFALVAPDGTRSRVNVFYQQGRAAATLRLLNDSIPTLEELAMPPVLTKLAEEPRGLILVTGPTGSGKSTTLAAMIDHINKTRSDHIITIEDPIEYVYQGRCSLIHQREVGADVRSFASALRSALREDPDVILVGEMRDYETISAAVTAAETGHLVMSTLHTIGAAQTIDRIIDVCPAGAQNQIRGQLAAVLRGVITQTENEQRRGIQKRVVEADEVRSVQKGDRVRLLNVGGVIATVLAPADRDGGVQVQAGPMKMTVKENELRLVEEKKSAPKPKPQPRRDAPRRELNIRSAESEVDVRGMSAEEALFEVDNFLSRAIMAGLPSVTVIHGKGTGVLRTAVQQHLRKNKRVKSVRSGVYGEGEQGVTIVELR